MLNIITLVINFLAKIGYNSFHNYTFVSSIQPIDASGILHTESFVFHFAGSAGLCCFHTVAVLLADL